VWTCKYVVKKKESVIVLYADIGRQHRTGVELKCPLSVKSLLPVAVRSFPKWDWFLHVRIFVMHKVFRKYYFCPAVFIFGHRRGPCNFYCPITGTLRKKKRFILPGSLYLRSSTGTWTLFSFEFRYDFVSVWDSPNEPLFMIVNLVEDHLKVLV